jgi:hypothetical protein
VGAAGGAAVVVTELIFFLIFFPRSKFKMERAPTTKRCMRASTLHPMRLCFSRVFVHHKFMNKSKLFDERGKETGEGGRGEKMEVI